VTTAMKHRIRFRDERGANLVEFAFVLPILVMLVFGIAEFGFAFNNYISLRNGVREGARQAVVASFGTDTTCGSTETQRLICLTKSRIGLPTTNTRVKVAIPSGYAVGNSVIVCAQYPLNSVTKLFQPFIGNKVLKAKTEMRIEQLSSDASGNRFAAGEEAALPNGDWTWCS